MLSICLLLMQAFLTIPALANGSRIALIIGNASYRYVPPLANSGNDARLLAATLRDLDFGLVGGGAQLDLDKQRFESLIQEFGRRAAGAEVALFYYAGHGFQVQGTNWLVPVAANPTRPQDLDFQMIDAALVLRQMDGAARLNIMILDACRNNPFGGRGLRTAAGGLAQMAAPEGTVIAYATQPGAVASDGTSRNSPYAEALANAVRTPGLDVLNVFNHVALAVKRTTAGAQLPWTSSSPIEGDFKFVAAGTTAVPSVSHGAPPVALGPLPAIPAATNPAPAVASAARTRFRTIGSKVISEGWTGGAILTFNIENQGADAWVGLRDTGTSGPCIGARIAGGLPVVDAQTFTSLRTSPSRGDSLAFLPAGGRAVATMTFSEAYCWSKLQAMPTVTASVLLVVVRGQEVMSLPLTADATVVRGTP
jgi:hypothetical protein